MIMVNTKAKIGAAIAKPPNAGNAKTTVKPAMEPTVAIPKDMYPMEGTPVPKP